MTTKKINITKRQMKTLAKNCFYAGKNDMPDRIFDQLFENALKKYIK